MDTRKPKITHTQRIAESRLFKVEAVDLAFSNGETRTYERICNRGRGTVVVVPVIDCNSFYLLREYAVGLDCYELGLVKGAIDTGETPLETANRELREELGMAAKHLTLLKCLATSPGYMDSVLQVVLAQDLFESPLAGDEPEPLERVVWRWDELDTLLTRDDVCDARVIASLFLAKKHLEDNDDK